MQLAYSVESGKVVGYYETGAALTEPFDLVTVTPAQWLDYQRGELVWDSVARGLKDAPTKATLVAARLAREARENNLSGSIATLRQWAADARAVTVTPGNSVATLQTVTNRLGVFFDRFADLLENR